MLLSQPLKVESDRLKTEKPLLNRTDTRTQGWKGCERQQHHCVHHLLVVSVKLASVPASLSVSKRCINLLLLLHLSALHAQQHDNEQAAWECYTKIIQVLTAPVLTLISSTTCLRKLKNLIRGCNIQHTVTHFGGVLTPYSTSARYKLYDELWTDYMRIHKGSNCNLLDNVFDF